MCPFPLTPTLSPRPDEDRRKFPLSLGRVGVRGNLIDARTEPQKCKLQLPTESVEEPKIFCVSSEVKEQRFGWLGRLHREHARLLRTRAVAGRQLDIVECQSAFGNLQPGAAACLDFVCHRLARLEANTIDLRVLTNFRRAIATVRRNHKR